MRQARLLVLAAYLAALGVALVMGTRAALVHPIAVALWADVAATITVFGFSLACRNSSFYDPYWSVAPLPIAIYWAMRPEIVTVNPIRTTLVVFLVAFWGARLTWNWLRGWGGLRHEDWRYSDMRASAGVFYWPLSFLGFHMGPTLIVFLGLLPVYAAVSAGREPFGYLDIVACTVTLGAILLESRADRQLKRYRDSNPPPEQFLRTGLWARCRHPNYFGEMGFWWGLWLFGLAANPAWWWTVVGPLTITLLFRFVSLPLIELRMQQRRPAYAEYADGSALVVPRLRRG